MQMLQISVAPSDRKAIGDAIDRLIALLDIQDGDPDREPAGDELDQSYTEDRRAFSPYPEEDAEDGGDCEPSLGAPEQPSGLNGTRDDDQERWAAGGMQADDREENGIGDMGGLREQHGAAA